MKKLKINGIYRAAKQRNYPEGSANEIINLRHREGAWEAIGNKQSFANIEGLRAFKLWHDLGNGDYAIIYVGGVQVQAGTKGGEPYYVYQGNAIHARIFFNGTESTQKLSDLDESHDPKVGCLNNVILYNTPTAIQYFTFQNGAYVASSIDYNQFRVWREENLPENNWKWLTSPERFRKSVASIPIGIPAFSFKSVNTWGAAYTTFGYDDSTNFPLNHESFITKEQCATLFTKFAELKTATEEAGLWAGKCYMISTLVLFDGTEVAHTPPTLQLGAHLEAKYYTYLHASIPKTESTQAAYAYSCSNISLNAYAMGWDSLLGLKFNVAGLDGIAKGLVKGVKIYLSLPKGFKYTEVTSGNISGWFARCKREPSSSDWSGYKAKNTDGSVNYYAPNGKLLYSFDDAYHFWSPVYSKDEEGDTAYFEAAFVPLDKINEGVFHTKLNVKELATSDSPLPMDANTRRGMTFKNTPISYNGRLFVSNIESSFASPFSPTDLCLWSHPKLFNWMDNDTPNAALTNCYTPYPSFFSGIGIDASTLMPVLGEKVYFTPSSTPSMGMFMPLSFNNTGYDRWSGSGEWLNSDPRLTYVSKLIFEVTITTDTGDKTIQSKEFTVYGYEHVNSESGKSVRFHLYPFTFPDITASKVTLYWQPVSFKGVAFSPVWYKTERKLNASSFHNFAWAYVDAVFKSPDNFASQNADVVTVGSFSPSSSPTITDQNRIQASALNNPFLFPVANSYRAGTSEVIGLHTVNNELSQGQFGEYPVIAFTKSGIWALNIGSGDILVNSVVPLANEVCNNPESITAIRKGIFFSTVEGLKILQGKTAVDITDQLEGNPENAVKSNTIVRTILNNDGLASFVSEVDFLDYVRFAKVGYDDYFEEIIVSNPSYAYSYVFSLENKTWTKRGETFTAFMNQYPHLLAVNGSTIYKTNMENKVGKNALIVTNPIGQDRFIKFEQLIARGVFGMAKVMVFASTDNRYYKLVSQAVVKDAFDVRLPRSPYSFRSFILVFEGSFDPSHYLNDFDLEMFERYGNKLR